MRFSLALAGFLADDPVGDPVHWALHRSLPSPWIETGPTIRQRAKTAGMTADPDVLRAPPGRSARGGQAAGHRVCWWWPRRCSSLRPCWRAGRHWLAWVEAAAIASLVGGLADWFAVTALFRRPLGLPIPHTAIVVERKDSFAETLGAFVQENFLSADAVSERLRGLARRRAGGGLAGGPRPRLRPGGPPRRRPGGRNGPAPRRGRAPPPRRAGPGPDRQGGPRPAGRPGPPAGDQGGPAPAAHRRRPQRPQPLPGRAREPNCIIASGIESPWWLPGPGRGSPGGQPAAAQPAGARRYGRPSGPPAAPAARGRTGEVGRRPADLRGHAPARRGNQGGTARATGRSGGSRPPSGRTSRRSCALRPSGRGRNCGPAWPA